MILLSDDEMFDAMLCEEDYDKMYENRVIYPTFQEVNSKLIAKAQLKKVVKEAEKYDNGRHRDFSYVIEDYGDWSGCKNGWEETNCTHVAIPYKFWQSLLEEIKDGE
jgi:hypothetical protein